MENSIISKSLNSEKETTHLHINTTSITMKKKEWDSKPVTYPTKVTDVLPS